MLASRWAENKATHWKPFLTQGVFKPSPLVPPSENRPTSQPETPLDKEFDEKVALFGGKQIFYLALNKKMRCVSSLILTFLLSATCLFSLQPKFTPLPLEDPPEQGKVGNIQFGPYKGEILFQIGPLDN